MKKLKYAVNYIRAWLRYPFIRKQLPWYVGRKMYSHGIASYSVLSDKERALFWHGNGSLWEGMEK